MSSRRSHVRRPADLRSHSAMAVDPADPDHILELYQSFAATWRRCNLVGYLSLDGGRKWKKTERFKFPEGGIGLVDPVILWDAKGQPHVAALALQPGPHYPVLGVVLFHSTDGGLHWGDPHVLYRDERAHQPAGAADHNSASPHYGNLYVAWCAGGDLCIAASRDHGGSWSIVTLPETSFCPEILVAPDGGVHLAWMDGQAGTHIRVSRSSDGGRSFSAPAALATGISSLRGSLPESEGWPHFPGANFRVLTVPTGALAPGGGIIFAWADFRQGVSRIYYRYSPDSGETWLGPADGHPLLTGDLASAPDQQEFLPRLLMTPLGEVCCAFYEYGPKEGRAGEMVDLVLTVSSDRGQTFTSRMVVTEDAWNPASDAPGMRAAGRGGMVWLRLDQKP